MNTESEPDPDQPDPDQPEITPENGCVEVGGVRFPVSAEPVHNLFFVDPRPVLAKVRMVNNNGKDNKAFPRAAKEYRQLSGELDWIIDPYSTRAQMGFWQAPVRHVSPTPHCCWSVYWTGTEWLGVYSSGLRPGKQAKVRTPQIVCEGDPKHAEFGNLYLPPMSWLNAQIAWTKPEDGFKKCEPWPRTYPTLTFAGSFGGGEYISEAILQI